VFEVLETWKGDLKKGDRITIPELACFASDHARSIFRRPGDKSPERVSGSRMILFLVKTPLLAGPAPKFGAAASRERERWDSANGQGVEMKVSVAWVEDGEAYAFIQMFNPGPSILVAYGTEKDLKVRLLHVLEVRASADKALATKDPGARAKALAALDDSDVDPAKNLTENYGWLLRTLNSPDEKARTDPDWDLRNYSFWCRVPILIPVLGTMGPKAATLLAALVQDNVNLDRYIGALVNALAEADPGTAQPVLVSILGREIDFWKAESPNLKQGWASPRDPLEEGEYPPPLKYRCSKIMEALNALERIKSTESKKAVSAFRDFWRSTPILEQEWPQIGMRTP